MKLSAQEHLIPGTSTLEKWLAISALGYSGIELRGKGDAEFKDRLPELREAVRQGAQISSICGTLPGIFPGSVEADARRDAIVRLKLLLSVAGELGIAGVISPAAFAIYPIPRTTPWPRTPAEDNAILADAFGVLGDHAKNAGTSIWIEPLNRYEDHMINRLSQAADICDQIGLDSVGVMADLFHMGIEEANSPAALIAAKRWLRHLHGADSTRAEPGTGHTNFATIKDALRSMGFDGFMALECRLSGEPIDSLRKAASVLG